MRSFPQIILLVGLLALGCAGPDGVSNDQRTTASRGAGVTGFSPQPTAEDVRTVQLYRTGSEASLPVIALGSGQTLTLRFDTLDDGRGGPVSVQFFHTDRFWNQRLMPVEYLRGFQSDDIRDYQQSAATRVRYTHYRYEFPNNVIEFTRSGNFIVRVTELGDDRAVLFERAFFISEETAEVALDVQSGIGAGLGGPFMQPVARVRPPSRFASPLYDFDVCFVREGRFEVTRCSQDPTLMGASLYQFFLPRDRAFEAPGPRYDLDLSILGAGPQIAAVDLSVSPYRITLQADDVRFSPAFFDDQLLAGQPVIRGAVQTLSRPETQAEYVATTFTFVPSERQRVAGRVLLTGSFNGWELNPAFEMQWDEESGTYVGTFLIKQGKYSYSYYVEDPVEQERRRRTVDLGRSTLYTALVYLHEPTYNTDRLLSVQSVIGQ